MNGYKLKMFSAALILFLSLLPFATRTASSASTSNANDDDGKVIASIPFDPKHDGFSFRNYGNKQHDWETDLTAADLAQMFGVDNVCDSGTTPRDCILHTTAEEWLDEKLKGMDGGHCDGFSVTTLRFFMGRNYKGKSAPKTWQSDADAVFDLQRNKSLENYIAYYHILQSLPEVSKFRTATFSKKPSEILKLVLESFKEESKDLYTLGIGKRINGEYKFGHSIVPVAVKDMGESVYHVIVYDNNYPGQTKFVEIDTEHETWRYHTASNPGDVERDYVGNTTTKTLSLKRMSDREHRRFQCPFCEEEEGDYEGAADAEGAKTPNEQVEFGLTGEGSMLIADPDGKRIGFDMQTKKYVEEIPGAIVLPYEGGLDKDIDPTYRLPFRKSAKPYTVTLSGKNLKAEVDADLVMTGPGFVVGFEDIQLDPGETLTMTISPDGKQLNFTASQDGQTPTIFLTADTGKNRPDYKFEIGGIKLNPGKSVTVRLDTEKGRLYFKDNDGKKDAYHVKLIRLNPNGTRNVFETKALKIGKADNYMIDYGKWDGKGGICVEDDEGDGFDDNKCEEEPNEATPKKSAYFWSPSHEYENARETK